MKQVIRLVNGLRAVGDLTEGLITVICSLMKD